jgi:NTE family protein
MALVLQGGGALGAYEWGAVTRLVELGWRPVAVSGVSIGAFNAAAIAGARGGIGETLDALWAAITLPEVPFLPAAQQATLSVFGNPNFYRLRLDVWDAPAWTSLCDVSPILRTLAEVCDFGRINAPDGIRLAVTATDVGSGAQATFCNRLAAGEAVIARPNHTSRRVAITPEHVLASGSLPPGFPATVLDGRSYWDGGLFDNTPVDAILDLLEEEELDRLPIFVIDLFATGDRLPGNLLEVKARMDEIAYQNRFWARWGGAAGFRAFAAMLPHLRLAEGADAAERQAFAWLMRRRALGNVRVLQAAPATDTGPIDFSALALRARYAAGRAAVDRGV